MSFLWYVRPSFIFLIHQLNWIAPPFMSASVASSNFFGSFAERLLWLGVEVRGWWDLLLMLWCVVNTFNYCCHCSWWLNGLPMGVPLGFMISETNGGPFEVIGICTYVYSLFGSLLAPGKSRIRSQLWPLTNGKMIEHHTIMGLYLAHFMIYNQLLVHTYTSSLESHLRPW